MQRPEHSQADAAGHGLLGARVAVVGTGEVLARALGTLHRLGAACVIREDPYAAIAEISRRPGAYAAVCLVLPCVYPDELAVIPAVRACSPSTRVLLAAADQQVTLLATALRLGATGVLTEQGVEWIGAEAPAPATTPQVEPAAVALAPTPAVPVRPASPIEDRARVIQPVPDTRENEFQADTSDVDTAHSAVEVESAANGDDGFDDEVEDEAEEGVDDDADLGLPSEPVLTAEELHALLHDEPVEEHRGR